MKTDTTLETLSRTPASSADFGASRRCPINEVLMKLLLGKVLIETDHIASAEIIAPHSVKLHFTSGYELIVHCGIKSDALATLQQDAVGFVTTLLNTDNPPKRE